MSRPDDHRAATPGGSGWPAPGTGPGASYAPPAGGSAESGAAGGYPGSGAGGYPPPGAGGYPGPGAGSYPPPGRGVHSTAAGAGSGPTGGGVAPVGAPPPPVGSSPVGSSPVGSSAVGAPPSGVAGARGSIDPAKLFGIVIAALGGLNFVFGFLPQVTASRIDQSLSVYAVGPGYVPILLLIAGLLALAAFLPGSERSRLAVAAVSVGGAVGALISLGTSSSLELFASGQVSKGLGAVLLTIFGIIQAVVAIAAYVVGADLGFKSRVATTPERPAAADGVAGGRPGWIATAPAWSPQPPQPHSGPVPPSPDPSTGFHAGDAPSWGPGASTGASPALSSWGPPAGDDRPTGPQRTVDPGPIGAFAQDPMGPVVPDPIGDWRATRSPAEHELPRAAPAGFDGPADRSSAASARHAAPGPRPAPVPTATAQADRESGPEGGRSSSADSGGANPGGADPGGPDGSASSEAAPESPESGSPESGSPESGSTDSGSAVTEVYRIPTRPKPPAGPAGS